MDLFVPMTTRARVVAVAAAGMALFMVWRLLMPAPVSTPGSIASLPRHDSGYWFDLAQDVSEGAAKDPRLGLTVAAAYGARAQQVPTLGVLAGVIKFGHGPEIVGTVVSGLPGGGVVLGERTAARAGKHGGTFEWGVASFGADSGTYCVWWNTSVVGVAVVTGLDPADSRALALEARNATQR